MTAAVEASVLGFAYTAIKALLEVFLISFCGYIFARNGTLNKSTLKVRSSRQLVLDTIYANVSVRHLAPGAPTYPQYAAIAYCLAAWHAVMTT
ncbi:hypothetical protein GGI16_009318, partial [Coemansia sp. S142-1]